MTGSGVLDIYQAAYLAGGSTRVADTALVALVETGRVRVQRSGEMSIVKRDPRHEMEVAVLDAIGPAGVSGADVVRQRIGTDARVIALAELLRLGGLLPGTGLTKLTAHLGGPFTLTSIGRWVLRELRADPPSRGAPPWSSAAQVALHGPGRMPDPRLRAALFDQPGVRRAAAPARNAVPRSRYDRAAALRPITVGGDHGARERGAGTDLGSAG
jgi:hypothetical protein